MPAHGSETGVVAGVVDTGGVGTTGVVAVVFVLPLLFFFGSDLGVVVTDGTVAVV